jgi:hypothetical protein
MQGPDGPCYSGPGVRKPVLQREVASRCPPSASSSPSCLVGEGPLGPSRLAQADLERWLDFPGKRVIQDIGKAFARSAGHMPGGKRCW